MALELKYTIPTGIGAITDANYDIKVGNPDSSRTLIKTGKINIGADNIFQIPVAGTGLILGQFAEVYVNDFTGANFTTSGRSVKWVETTDDGIIPPPVNTLKLLCIGDSITANGSSVFGEVGRGSTQSATVRPKGPHIAAANMICSSDYLIRDDFGVGNTETSHIIGYLPDILAKDFDLAVLMIGTNDVDAGVPIETIKTNATTIINALTASHKLLINPVMHRFDSGANAVAWNNTIDELNTFYFTQASTNPNAEIAPVPTMWNDNATTIGGDGILTDDGLHPLDRGGVYAGASLASALDAFYPSNLDKVNILPDFSGSAGQIKSSATGNVPDAYRGDFATANVGVGFNVVEIDTKRWVEIQTNGDVSVPSGRTVIFRGIDNVQSPAHAKFVAEMLVVFTESTSMEIFKLTATTASDPTYGQGQWNSEGDLFEAGVEYRIRTLPFYALATDTIRLELFARQYVGPDVSFRIADYQVYEVESI